MKRKIVGNCIVQTETERNRLCDDIFGVNVAGYNVKVGNNIVRGDTLLDMLKIVKKNKSISDSEIVNSNYGYWGEVGSLRGYTIRSLKQKFSL